MANETKTATSRRKSSTETEVATSAPAKKVAKTSAAAASVTAAATPAATKPIAKTAAKKAPAVSDKPQPEKAASKKAAPAKKVAKTKATGQPITADARLRHIEVAAYYIAEKSGFSGDPSECWLAAEREVDGLLLAGKL